MQGGVRKAHNVSAPFCLLPLKCRRSGERDLRYACLLPTAYCLLPTAYYHSSGS
jgi:hypothetical protein